MSVEKELQGLTGVKQNRRETDQAYFERIVKALNDVSESKYNKLSKAAQNWAEDATTAYNDREEISAFPEAEDDEPEAEARPRRGRSNRDEDEEAPQEEEAESESAGEPDDQQPEEDDMPTTRTDEDEDEAPPRKRGSAKAPPARKTAPAATGKTGKTGGGGAKPGGGLIYVRELLVRNPDITVPDLAEKVKAKGFVVSTQTLHTTRSGFRQDLRVLQDAGLLKRKLV